jgi:hypothetical protein
MLLFLMGVGVDLPTIGLIVLLLLIFGRLIFWLSKKLFRKVLKESSDGNIKLLSRVSAFILSPIMVIGSLALIIYISTQSVPRESEEEIERSHYEMMDDDIKDDLKIGLSKTEVVELFGEADTTQSVLVYDLSLPEAKEKYLLEITFDAEGLKEFKRHR